LCRYSTALRQNIEEWAEANCPEILVSGKVRPLSTAADNNGGDHNESTDDDDNNEDDAMSDEDILWVWRDHCSALRDLWPEDVDASSWEGVHFEDVGGEERVVEIHLDGLLGNVGHVPAALGELDALRVLNLANNRLTSVPTALEKISSLAVLDLRNNRLRTFSAALKRLSDRGVTVHYN
jgi:hypothetical protein